MAYRIAPFLTILSDLQGPSPIASLFNVILYHPFSSWQDFNWHSTANNSEVTQDWHSFYERLTSTSTACCDLDLWPPESN